MVEHVNLEITLHHLLSSNIPFKKIKQEGLCTSIAIDAFSGKINFTIFDCSWEVEGGGKKGFGIKNAIRVARSMRQKERCERNKIKRVVKREKAYNKKTPANLLYKLQEANKYYEDGNSMSKSARLANVPYEAFKKEVTGNGN